MECEVKAVRGRQFFMLRDEIIERERAARQIPGTMVAGPFGSWESHYLLQRAPERVRRPFGERVSLRLRGVMGPVRQYLRLLESGVADGF